VLRVHKICVISNNSFVSYSAFKFVTSIIYMQNEALIRYPILLAGITEVRKDEDRKVISDLSKITVLRLPCVAIVFSGGALIGMPSGLTMFSSIGAQALSAFGLAKLFKCDGCLYLQSYSYQCHAISSVTNR